jgi:exonuclease SbcD
MKVLHFADAHIDIAAHGRRDPASGLPLRVLDFLKALDTIVEAAISERVDLVVFAGDAYKDRTPVPTFQREWGKRIIRLSDAGIPTLMLVGNHDLSPAVGRANALQEFETLQVPHVHVVSRPSFLKPEDLEGLPIQILALPWVSRSGMLAALQDSAAGAAEPDGALVSSEEQAGEEADAARTGVSLDANIVYAELEQRIGDLVRAWLDRIDPHLPVMLAAHASVQGAKYGGERGVMLGSDLVLPGSLVRDPRLDYVALGHIHKAQDLNEGAHPPVIYPGSIERVDFGEAADDKYYVVAQVQQGRTEVEWRKLNGRRFIDRKVTIQDEAYFQQQMLSALPPEEEMEDAIVRLVVEYPRAWDSSLDEGSLLRSTERAFEFHLVRRPQMEARLRLPGDAAISSLEPLDLLDLYWNTLHTEGSEKEALAALARELIGHAEPNP